MTNNNKIVMLTGGTGKLGIFTAKYLFDNGYTVILTSRSIKASREACRNIFISSKNQTNKCEKNRLIPCLLDLSKKISIERFFESQLKNNLMPNSIVNIAAVDNQDPLEILNYNSLESVLKLNFTGPAYLSSLICTYWKNNEIKGSIVTISTLLTHFGSVNSSIYAASKSALEGFFINLAAELGKYDIRSNIIGVSGMLGDLMIESTPTRVAILNEKLYKNNTLDKSLIPLKRFGAFKEYSSVVEFFISDRSSYITGQCINVDGGLSIVYPGYLP